MISVMTLNFDIMGFPFLDGGVPRSTSYGVYISQLVRFAGVCGCVAGFDAREFECRTSSTGLSVS